MFNNVPAGPGIILLELSVVDVFCVNVICCNLCCCCGGGGCFCCIWFWLYWLYWLCCGCCDGIEDGGVVETIWKWGDIGVLFAYDWEDNGDIDDIWDTCGSLLNCVDVGGGGDLVWVSVFEINLFGEDNGGSFE